MQVLTLVLLASSTLPLPNIVGAPIFSGQAPESPQDGTVEQRIIANRIDVRITDPSGIDHYFVFVGQGIGGVVENVTPNVGCISPVVFNIGGVGAHNHAHTIVYADCRSPVVNRERWFLEMGLGAGGYAPGTKLQPAGDNYCQATVNSTGQAAFIMAQGASVSANNTLLVAAGLPQGQFGYFLTSQTQDFVNPPGSSGFLCLGGAIGRFTSQVQNSGPEGVISIAVDLTALPQPTGPVAVMPGDTWNFQCWYRDVGNTNNFTDAVEIMFQP